ncbi:hypothetical protein BVC80_8793g12 [Macleaya cordata]|uniref:Uncharacterized protein n=1 Tax=Macleaya cordata TaxID=56857 RepID=A0A200PSZ2_MACCD|nr:hypothetical protein BVC80_8793g12 [Macleaya cordata]
MLPVLFFLISLFLLCFLFISLSKRLKRTKEEEKNPLERSISLIFGKTHQTNKTHPVFVEILNSNPPKWVSLISPFPSHLPVEDVDDDRISDGSELDKEGNLVGEDCEKNGDPKVKRKKKRAKKKRQNSKAEDYESQLPVLQEKNSLDSLYPFTSSSSVTQRKIKQQYDQLVKSHDSKALTLAQVLIT